MDYARRILPPLYAIAAPRDEAPPPPRMDVKITQALEGGLTTLGILLLLLFVISLFIVVLRERSPGHPRGPH